MTLTLEELDSLELRLDAGYAINDDEVECLFALARSALQAQQQGPFGYHHPMFGFSVRLPVPATYGTWTPLYAAPQPQEKDGSK